MLNFALLLKLNILEYMRIINDGSTLILLDEESGKFFNIKKVPSLVRESFNYVENSAAHQENELDSKGYIFYIEMQSCLFNEDNIFRKYGYAGYDGTVIIKPIYDGLWIMNKCFLATMNAFNINLSEGQAKFSHYHSRIQAYLNVDGTPKIEFSQKGNIFASLFASISLRHFDLVSDFSYGLAIVFKNGKMGVASSDGKVIIEPDYDAINGNNWFQSIFCFNTYENEYRGYIRLDKVVDGKIHTSYAIIRGNRVQAIIDDIDRISCLNNGIGFVAQKENKEGFYNINGEQILPFSYIHIWDVAENTIKCKSENTEELYSIRDGEIAAKTNRPFEFISGSRRTNESGVVACIKENGIYLFLNNNFHIVAKLNMPEFFKGTVVAHSYGEGIVGIKDGDGYYSNYFVNLNGEPIFSFRDKKIDIISFETGFVSGKARVSIYYHDHFGSRSLDGYYDAVITSTGEIVTQNWVNCDMREPNYDDNDYNDISDAFDDDPSAYWNID
jgi:hypothetical protein